MRDIDEVFSALNRSSFRSRFALGEAERRYVRGRDLEDILGHGKRFIAERLAVAEPANDGGQTPMRGHPVFVAQHATGTCCRGCLEKWHQIPKGREMTREERGYVMAVIERWLREQGVGKDGGGEQQRLF